MFPTFHGYGKNFLEDYFNTQNMVAILLRICWWNTLEARYVSLMFWSFFKQQLSKQTNEFH